MTISLGILTGIIILLMLGAVILGTVIACILSKTARYKVSRFFSELFAGVFIKKRAKE